MKILAINGPLKSFTGTPTPPPQPKCARVRTDLKPMRGLVHKKADGDGLGIDFVSRARSGTGAGLVRYMYVR